MSEFNQGAYDAFLTSIADLTSRDLVRKKLRTSNSGCWTVNI